MHPIVESILAKHRAASLPDSAQIKKLTADLEAALTNVADLKKSTPPSDNLNAVRIHEDALALAEDRAMAAQDHLQQSLTELEHSGTVDPDDVAYLRELAGLPAK